MNNPKLLLCALTLPPPVHGMAYINQRVLEHLKGPQTYVVDLSPRSLQRGVGYHVRKISRVLRAWLMVLWLALRHLQHRRTFYTVIDGGLGAYYTLVLAATASALGYRVFLHHHAATHTKATTPAMRGLVKLAPKAVHVALSEGMKADLLQRYPRLAEVIVSDNTCHLEMPPAPTRPPRQGPLKLGMLSNLTVEKGAILALETAVAAQRTGLDVTLTLAGPMVDEAVRTAVEKAKSVLGPRLHIAGPLYGEAKIDFFRRIDVFLFPTMYANEAQPLVLCEAMSQGCLVIAYGRGYIPEVIGEENILVPPDANFIDFAFNELKQIRQKKRSLTAQYSINRYQELHTLAATQFQKMIKKIVC